MHEIFDHCMTTSSLFFLFHGSTVNSKQTSDVKLSKNFQVTTRYGHKVIKVAKHSDNFLN